MLYNYKGRVARVIDADTLVVDIDLGFNVWCKETVRLLGVDCWEPRGENRHKGIAAKEAVANLLADEYFEVRVETIKDKTGKYGRYLARIWIGDVCLNDWIKEQGHAKVE